MSKHKVAVVEAIPGRLFVLHLFILTTIVLFKLEISLPLTEGIDGSYSFLA